MDFINFSLYISPLSLNERKVTNLLYLQMKYSSLPGKVTNDLPSREGLMGYFLCSVSLGNPF